MMRFVCFIKGLTHAGVWAAACAYMTQAVPAINRPTAQMILQSLHHAFGRGCGTIIGGAIINKYGMNELHWRALFLKKICVIAFVDGTTAQEPAWQLKKLDCSL